MSFRSETSATLRSLALLAFALACSIAQAALVTPGQQDIPIEEIAFEFTPPVVQQTADFSLSVPGGGTVTVRLTDAVGLVDGAYAFETRFIVLSAPVGLVVDKAVRTNYAGFTTDARPEPDRGGDAVPTTATRSPSPGSGVQFNFVGDQQVAAGTNGSSFFAILTNATDYEKVGELQLGMGDLLLPPIAVFSPVPEAEQWVVLLAGIGLLVALTRRRGLRRSGRPI